MIDWIGLPGILSPSLFVIEAKALRMVTVAENAGLITGFNEERDVSPISYLQFVTLVSCNASENQIENAKATLICFEAVSGLKVNHFKSELIGIRVEDSLMHKYVEILGCTVGSFPATYLSFPCVWGRPINQCGIRYWRELKGKYLLVKQIIFPLEEKVTLIRSALPNLPVYYMSILKLSIA